jgi:hypothetical protein
LSAYSQAIYLVIALDSALQKVKHEDYTNYMHPLRICLEHKEKEKEGKDG